MTLDPPPRFNSRLGAAILVVILLWLACAFWHSIKPMPAGTHSASLPARLGESQLQFIDGRSASVLAREIALIDRAEEMIVLDQCPLPRAVSEHLLAHRRQRPNLTIVLVTDPRNPMDGGTPAQTLNTLEAAGIIVARTRLERLRDSNPLYSSFWRLTLGWWTDPFDDPPDRRTLTSTLRNLNGKANQRQLLAADDGAGGWASLIASAPVKGGDAAGVVGLEVRGQLARDIVASELKIAAWSTDDDRLPSAPPIEDRGVGTIDARFLTEGAIQAALRDALSLAGAGDGIDMVIPALGDLRIVAALRQAAGRGARVRLMLDPALASNQAVAAELLRTVAGSIDIRWHDTAGAGARFTLISHRNDAWLEAGSADYTRRALDDLNLEAAIELHMPAQAAPARAAAAVFARLFSAAVPYADHADASSGMYWRYRFAEATGLAMR